MTRTVAELWAMWQPRAKVDVYPFDFAPHEAVERAMASLTSVLDREAWAAVRQRRPRHDLPDPGLLPAARARRPQVRPLLPGWPHGPRRGPLPGRHDAPHGEL